jgi:DNA polymerase-3 subunit epsilon
MAVGAWTRARFSDVQGSTLNNDQLDFAFVADLPTITPPPKKRVVRSKPAPKPSAPMATTPQLLAPVMQQEPPDRQLVASDPDVESLAVVLEAHPDYRVLRRLRPRLDWSPSQGQAVCRIIVLDTETTGLDQMRDKIMELALLRVDVNVDTGLPVGPVQVYDGLEDPGMPIPREVQDITGIDDSMVQGQRLDDDRVLAMLDSVDLVIAHNAGFDRPFVEARFPQARAMAWACSFADINWKEQGRGSAKLESLARDMGLFYDAHRAEMDCHALLAVLATPLPKLAHTGLAHLMAQAGKPSYRLQATNAPFDAKDKLKARGYRWSAEQKVWHTRVGDGKALQTEFDWLKEHAYHQRSAVVQFEKLDAQVRYSARTGEMLHHQL